MKKYTEKYTEIKSYRSLSVRIASALALIGNEKEIYDAVVYIKCLTGHNHVHSCADIHAYRADYCTKAYLTNAKPISELREKKINYTAITGKRNKDGSVIIKSAVYYCRKDKASIAYDREAMIFASQMLGHNREDVVAEQYLYKLDTVDLHSLD